MIIFEKSLKSTCTEFFRENSKFSRRFLLCFLRNKIRKIIFWRIIWVEYLSKIIFIIILVDKNKRIQNWQKPFRQFVDDSEPPHFWNLIRKIESLLNIDFKKLGYKLRNFLTWAKKWQFGRKPPLKGKINILLNLKTVDHYIINQILVLTLWKTKELVDEQNIF